MNTQRLILAGGTGLYFRAELQGLSPMPPAEPAMRAALEAAASMLRELTTAEGD